MLATIKFNGKMSGGTIKIQNIWSCTELSEEMPIVHLFIAKSSPKYFFSGRFAFPKTLPSFSEDPFIVYLHRMLLPLNVRGGREELDYIPRFQSQREVFRFLVWVEDDAGDDAGAEAGGDVDIFEIDALERRDNFTTNRVGKHFVWLDA